MSSAVIAELDRLIAGLEARASRTSASAGDHERPGDAIDAVLREPVRTTAVRSLRGDPVIEQFRQELVDGLIRVDTARRVLEVLNAVVSRLGV